MNKKSFSVIVRAIVKKCLKTSALGRWMYPFFQKCWRSVVIPYRRRRLQKHGFDCLGRLHTILVEHGIDYYCDYGTLLGLVRDRGFIPHDDDIDISLSVHERRKPSEILRILLSKGYRYIHGFVYEGRVIEFSVMDRTGISIDFFVTVAAPGECKRYFDGLFWFPNVNYPSETANSVVRSVFLDSAKNVPLEIGGIVCLVPSNREEMLASVYGETWRTPIKDFVNKERVRETLPGFAYRLTENDFLGL